MWFTTKQKLNKLKQDLAGYEARKEMYERVTKGLTNFELDDMLNNEERIGRLKEQVRQLEEEMK